MFDDIRICAGGCAGSARLEAGGAWVGVLAGDGVATMSVESLLRLEGRISDDSSAEEEGEEVCACACCSFASLLLRI